MHPALLNPISRCAFRILDKKNRRRNGAVVSVNSRKKRTHCKTLKETSDEFAFNFLESASSIPEAPECFYEFITMHPAYQSSNQIDQLRSSEYFHLNKPEAKVCLDYCGFGLFSYLQSFQLPESSAFSLSPVASNLRNHALYGSAVKGTVENDIKTRIMDCLNTPEDEYGLVFTASRGSAFQLLAEYYPFETKKKLLTMFDHESQSVNWMAQRARDKGSKVYSAKFMWPSLEVCDSEMMKLLSSKKKRKIDSATGLFVFPVQSRVSGVKYAYKWMALAKKNRWHVLLDAGSLGPKAMESFGLSLFRPDFIITSFYRVFGSDPTGFGCLLIKKSVLSCLRNRSNGTDLGIVRIVSVFPQHSSEFAEGGDCFDGAEEVPVNANEERMVLDGSQGSHMPVFSSPYTESQVRDSNEIEWGRNSTTYEANDIIEETDSIGEIMKSPIFSDDESSDTSLWIYLGQSPSSSENSGLLKSGKLDSRVPISWFFEEKNHKRLLPKILLNDSHNMSNDHVLSFDTSVLSVSEDENQIKRDLKEEPRSNVIQEEIDKEAIEPHVAESSSADGVKANSSISTSDHKFHENDLRSEICKEIVEVTYESAIRRETEFEFILFDKRGGESGDNNEGDLNMDPRVYPNLDDDRPSKRLIYYLDSEKGSSHNSDDGGQDDSDYEDDREPKRREPKIVCKHIDHINMFEINKTTIRIRYLVNWLVGSLLHLRLSGCYGKHGVPLVCIYGPKIKDERGATVAFNVRDKGGGLIHPETVQKLADRNGIHLGVGFLSNIKFDGDNKAGDGSLCNFISNSHHERKAATFRLEVVIASLGFLTNFSDIYKLWAFVAQFLDPSFIETSEM